MNYLEKLAHKIRSHVPQDKLPSEDGVDSLFLFYAVLACSKGQSVTARDVHDAWVAWMISQGRHHDSMRPFEELPPEIQGEDEPYVRAIIKALGDI